MKITNTRNLPDAIVRAVQNDPYSKGASDFSVTELIQPPRIRALKIKHKDEIVEDAADRIYSLLGQSIHTVLERANNPNNAIAEKRYFATFGKFTVSAQIDSLDLEGGILTDFKTTTSWKFMADKPPDPDYIAQLNCQIEILRRNGLDARELRIVGILRDWNQRESKSNPNYPSFQVAQMPIEMWSREETTTFIQDRIKRHLDAEISLPLCTAAERWEKAPAFAIMKGVNKRAVKLVYTIFEAQDFVKNMGSNYRIEHRKGESIRCLNYCVARPYCDQYKATLQT